MLYRHTQVGWPILALSSLTIAIVAIVAVLEGELAILVVTAAVFTAVELLFLTLTVEIDTQYLSLRFGIGALRRSIRLNTIRRFAAVRNPWYAGWGIRVTPDGMLYNVAGRSAVELLLEDGRRVQVGTPDPESLIRALERATRLPRSASTEDFPEDADWRRRNRLIAATVAGIVIVWMLVML